MKTKPVFHSNLARYTILIGISLSIIYWVLESFVHAYIFHEGTLIGQIFDPKPHELWMRSLGVTMIILFSIYARFLLFRPRVLERMLQDVEKKYRTVFDEASDGFVLIDSKTGRITECNREFERQTGRNIAQLSKMRIWEIRPKEKGEAAREKFFEVREKGGGESGELEFQRPDGSIVSIEFKSKVVEIKNKKYLLSLARDITERRKTEEALKRSEIFLQDVFDSIQDGISVLDKDLNIVRVNRWINEKYGDNSLILGGKCYKIYQRRESVCPWCPSIKALKTGEVQGEVVPYPTEERPTGWIFLSSYPLKDETGMVTGVIEYVKDITELKHKEEELRLSETNYREIFNAANDAIFIHDPETGKILDVNKKMREMFGYTPDELATIDVGTLSENKPPYTLRDAVRWMKKVIKEGPQLIEWRVRHKSGRLFWVEINIQSATIGGKERVLAIMRNITERKKMEQMRNNLIRDVSHSLKTPIVTAKMANNEIGRAIESNDIEKAREFQMMIRGNIDKAYKDISNILELYALEEGKPVKLDGSVSLRKALDDVILGIKDIVEYKKLKLVTDIPEEADRILINGKEIYMLLFNVLDNAVKFTDKGHVAVSARTAGGMVEITVEDTGCGIPDGEKEKVFDKFYQRSAAISGVGLGLSICKEIAQRYNAEITVVSEGKGKGTRVVISLPKG